MPLRLLRARTAWSTHRINLLTWRGTDQAWWYNLVSIKNGTPSAVLMDVQSVHSADELLKRRDSSALTLLPFLEGCKVSVDSLQWAWLVLQIDLLNEGYAERNTNGARWLWAMRRCTEQVGGRQWRCMQSEQWRLFKKILEWCRSMIFDASFQKNIVWQFCAQISTTCNISSFQRARETIRLAWPALKARTAGNNKSTRAIQFALGLTDVWLLDTGKFRKDAKRVTKKNHSLYLNSYIFARAKIGA